MRSASRSLPKGFWTLLARAPIQDPTATMSCPQRNRAPALVKEVEGQEEPLAVSGAVSIAPYPPSAYLTQLAFRVLNRCYARDDPELSKVTKLVRIWSRSEINRQIALITTGSRIADPLQLAYAVILASSASVDEQTSPRGEGPCHCGSGYLLRPSASGRLLATEPAAFPLSRGRQRSMLRVYELLTQLLICEPLQDELLKYLPKLQNFRTTARSDCI